MKMKKRKGIFSFSVCSLKNFLKIHCIRKAYYYTHMYLVGRDYTWWWWPLGQVWHCPPGRPGWGNLGLCQVSSQSWDVSCADNTSVQWSHLPHVHISTDLVQRDSDNEDSEKIFGGKIDQNICVMFVLEDTLDSDRMMSIGMADSVV